jgi:hypothetical protein
VSLAGPAHPTFSAVGTDRGRLQRVSPRLSALGLFAASSLVLTTVRATPPDPGRSSAAANALGEIGDADPIEISRVVLRLGDRAILALLADGQPGPARLWGIRAARWLVAPEHALPALAELLAGRDSLLAPAAALASMRIARELDADALSRREADPTQLALALSTLRRVLRTPQVRADLRMMAADAVASIEATAWAAALPR